MNSFDEPPLDEPVSGDAWEELDDLRPFEVTYTPEPQEKIDSEALLEVCENFFAPGGTAGSADFDGQPGEYRPQQLEMARAICRALGAKDNANLCIEAPTGVGKSFAYLLPMVLRARQSKRGSLISTETINLQEQIIHKDLPQLAELLGTEIKAAIAKGRRNYLCRRRYALLSGEQKDALLPLPSLAGDLARLDAALGSDYSGERDAADWSVDSAVWDLVCCELGNCLGRKCEFFRNCFYQQARRKWEEADIVVANHALFFTDLARRAEGGNDAALLPEYGAVVIDEAHAIEECAAECFGMRLSRTGLVHTLNRLYNPDRAKGLLVRPGAQNVELRSLVSQLRDESYAFFEPYVKLLEERRETALAVRAAPDLGSRLTIQLTSLVEKLTQIVDDEEDDSYRSELNSLLDRLRETLDALDEFQRARLPDRVYYAETEPHGGISLNGTPVEVSEILSQLLFRQNFPAILCSATLTVRNHFDHFLSRSGFVGGASLRLDSPFDPRRAQLRIATDFPDPATPEFTQALINYLPKLLETTDGKAFVLFTSYQAMRACAEALQGEFDRRQWQLLVQGGSLSRYRMLAEFKRDVNSVLFGTDSFWTGVDVPGEALSQVIITKLPFAVPSHPVMAARIDAIEARGGNSFVDYSLPEAVLKFRQGVGRLIRRASDSGVITVLDRRIVTRRYGRAFLESVPYAPKYFHVADENLH